MNKTSSAKSMNEQASGSLQSRRFAELSTTRVTGREVWPSEDVTLPPLPTGSLMLNHMKVQEVPGDVRWDSPTFRSTAAFMFECHDVTVHTSAGIICFDQTVIEDTLDHTAGFLHHYQEMQGGITLSKRKQPVTELPGTHVCCLTGGHDNYYHWTTECLGRLAVAAEAIKVATSVLMPRPETLFQMPSLNLTGLPQAKRVHFVEADETLRVEHLILPWTPVGQYCPSPRLAPFFARLRAAVPSGAGPQLPSRIYIDRRKSAARRLTNEDELVGQLERQGIVAVRLEDLPVFNQIRLFAQAELIVAPHGAGLTNLLYAGSGCRVVELQMDSAVNAGFRRLAAICKLDYDCVIGRQTKSGPERVQNGKYALTGVHAREWEVSVTHVLGAVEQSLTGCGNSATTAQW